MMDPVDLVIPVRNYVFLRAFVSLWFIKRFHGNEVL
jgi:hypothetical protein